IPAQHRSTERKPAEQTRARAWSPAQEPLELTLTTRQVLPKSLGLAQLTGRGEVQASRPQWCTLALKPFHVALQKRSVGSTPRGDQLLGNPPPFHLLLFGILIQCDACVTGQESDRKRMLSQVSNAK